MNTCIFPVFCSGFVLKNCLTITYECRWKFILNFTKRYGIISHPLILYVFGKLRYSSPRFEAVRLMLILYLCLLQVFECAILYVCKTAIE